MRDPVVQLHEHAEGQFAKPADPRRTLLDVGCRDGLILQEQDRDGSPATSDECARLTSKAPSVDVTEGGQNNSSFRVCLNSEAR